MATSLQEDTPFCLERLEIRVKKINGSPVSAADGRSLLVDLVGCFIVVGRQVGRINRKVDQLEQGDEKDKKNDSDLMRSGLSWFGDKVLPTLISTGIITILIWLASVNGHISITP